MKYLKENTKELIYYLKNPIQEPVTFTAYDPYNKHVIIVLFIVTIPMLILEMIMILYAYIFATIFNITYEVFLYMKDQVIK